MGLKSMEVSGQLKVNNRHISKVLFSSLPHPHIQLAVKTHPFLVKVFTLHPLLVYVCHVLIVM